MDAEADKDLQSVKPGLERLSLEEANAGLADKHRDIEDQGHYNDDDTASDTEENINSVEQAKQPLKPGGHENSSNGRWLTCCVDLTS